MNKPVLQKIILSFFMTFFLPSSCMMDTLKKFSYKCIERPIVYRVGVKIIDNTAMSLSRFAVWFIHLISSKKRMPLVYALFKNKAQQRLNRINSELLAREAQLIDAIYDDYGITTEQRKMINSIIDQSKEYEKKYMSEPHQEATHDLEFPPHIITLCMANNIDPKSIKTVIAPAEQEYNAAAIGIHTTRTIINNIMNIESVVTPPTIKFFPPFFKTLKEVQDGLWAHEARHHICQHSTRSSDLVFLVAHITARPNEKIENNQNYLLLAVEEERQAEILYNNAQLASITRNFRRNNIYPSKILFLSHYAQLTEIDKLYGFPDELRAYKRIPLQKLNFPKQYRSKSPFNLTNHAREIAS